MFFLLKKALYGLKLTNRSRFDKLKGIVLSWAFLCSKAKNSWFFKMSEIDLVFMLVYVDDGGSE